MVRGVSVCQHRRVPYFPTSFAKHLFRERIMLISTTNFLAVWNQAFADVLKLPIYRRAGRVFTKPGRIRGSCAVHFQRISGQVSAFTIDLFCVRLLRGRDAPKQSHGTRTDLRGNFPRLSRHFACSFLRACGFVTYVATLSVVLAR